MQRRRHYRIATSLRPQRILALDRNQRALDAAAFAVLDLSGGGLLAKAGQPLAIKEGERLLLSLSLDGDAVEVTVTVAWVRPLPRGDAVEAGCRFDELSSRDQIAILDHIRRNQIRSVS